MVIGKSSRENLRNHRKFIQMALKAYVEGISAIIGITPARIRIMDSVESTRITVSKEIVPEQFVDMVLAENESKKYHFEFYQNKPGYIQIIIKNKPLITEGQGILLYFFRELVQYVERCEKEKKKKQK